MSRHILGQETNDFTQYLTLLARGRNSSRDLTQKEAQEAMQLLLKGKVLPEQIGAFFMLMRVKEETPEELAGFAQACESLWILNNNQPLQADIIWPSYAGKRRQPLWYVLSMKLLTNEGYSILCHGTRGHTPNRQYLEDVLEALNWPIATSKEHAQEQINKHKFSYLSCEHLNIQFQSWLMTKHTLGLRSPINTLLRIIAPKHSVGVQSVFHPSYAVTHQKTCLLINKTALIIKGEGGEFEANPERKITARFQFIGNENTEPFIIENQVSHYDNKCDTPCTQELIDIWKSDIVMTTNPYAYYAIIHTTTLVLMLKNKQDLSIQEKYSICADQAIKLWEDRDKSDLLKLRL
jgi:anthranilate phosphoribosyltransferase